MATTDPATRIRIIGPDDMPPTNRSCPCEHWMGTALIYDNGTVDPPGVGLLDGTPDPDTGLDDRTLYFPPNPVRPVGVLRIQWWGHHREQVLAAVQRRYHDELAKRERS